MHIHVCAITYCININVYLEKKMAMGGENADVWVICVINMCVDTL